MTKYRIIREEDGHYWTLDEDASRLLADSALMQSREVTSARDRQTLRDVADWLRGLL